MLDVARMLHVRSLDDLAEMTIEEARWLVASREEEQRREDEKWDRRFTGLCAAIRAFGGLFPGGVSFDLGVFYPALFKSAGPITDREEMKKRLIAFAAGVGRKQLPN